MRSGAIGVAVSIALLASCSASPTATISLIPPPDQAALRTALDRAEPLSASTRRYELGETTVELTKVVPLSDGMLGLRFEISAPGMRPCCSLFPRISLTGARMTPGAGDVEVDVAESRTSIAPDGTLGLRLFGGDPEHEVGSFSIHLAALGVTY